MDTGHIAIIRKLGEYIVGTTQDVEDMEPGVDFSLTVGVTTAVLIACAVRNPRWSQWFVAFDEENHLLQGTDSTKLDADIMEWLPVGAVE